MTATKRPRQNRHLFAGIIAIVLVIVPDAKAITLVDPTHTLEIVETHTARRQRFWQSTRSAFDLVKISADAFGPEPVADIIGILGMTVSVPLTALAVPFDVLAYPFRRSRVVRLRVHGKALKNEQPLREIKIVLTTNAKYPNTDIVSHPLYHVETSSQTTRDGILDMVFDLSFGPNSDVGINIGIPSWGTLSSFWVTRKGNSLNVLNPGGQDNWRLEPIQNGAGVRDH